VGNYQFDFERFCDRFQLIGGRLEWQRTGHDGFGIVFDNVFELCMANYQSRDYGLGPTGACALGQRSQNMYDD
jgi:hypothetical protein